MILNPEYVADNYLYNVCTDCAYVGFELWQVKSGTIFDDIIVTDSVEEADEFIKGNHGRKKDVELKMFKNKEEADRKREEEERKKKEEEEEKKKKEEEDDDDDKDEL